MDQVLDPLAWNQQPASVYVRSEKKVSVAVNLKPAKWENFYAVGVDDWDIVNKLIESGRVSVYRIPSTRFSSGTSRCSNQGIGVLDLCCVPGCKSFGIMEGMNKER